jgi:hypothetical protein
MGTPAYTLNTQAELVLLLVPSAVVPGPDDAVCVTDAGAGLAVDAVAFRLPAGVLGVRLGSVEVARPLVNPSGSRTSWTSLQKESLHKRCAVQVFSSVSPKKYMLPLQKFAHRLAHGGGHSYVHSAAGPPEKNCCDREVRQGRFALQVCPIQPVFNRC